MTADAFAPLLSALDAAERAAADAQRAERAAIAAAKRAEVEEERARSVVKAQTFRVDATPGRAPAVAVSAGNVTVRASDGRIAKGYIDDGDWAIFQIGDHELPSTHPEMERIAREARSQWEAGRDV